MNYLEYHTSQENSEDNSDHIISMSFILLISGVHIRPTQLLKGKKAALLHTFCHYSCAREKPQQSMFLQLATTPLMFPIHWYSLIPTNKNTPSNTYWVYRKQAKAPGARAITFSSSECRIYPPWCRISRQKTEESRMTDEPGLSSPLFCK